MRSATTLTRLAALTLVAGAAGAAAPPVEAVFPGGNGEDRVGPVDALLGTPSTSIFTVNPAGGTPAVLIRNGRLNFDPAWSANGNDLAFDSCPSTSNCNIFTAGADGTGVTRITNNPYFEEFPRWGPDGDRLVFMRRVAGNMDIYVKHLGSGNVTRLTDSRAFDEFPEFSPDGTTVAFGSNRSGSYDIWTKNVQTGQLTRITTDPHARADSYPSFSPDFFEEYGIVLCRVLTDRGTEYCGNPEHHDYELYLAVEDIDHTRTKTKSPQTNGICERFHRTVLDEFYRVAFRKKIYRTIDELQNDLDGWVTAYNETRPHQGRWCYGKTPMQTFLDALPIAREKLLPAA